MVVSMINLVALLACSINEPETNSVIQLDADGDGFSIGQGDCNDEDFNISPSSPDLYGDSFDQNCDGVDGVDGDGDGYASIASGGTDCEDSDPLIFDVDQDGDGESMCDGDCDDFDGLLNHWDQDDDEYIGFRLLVFGATFTLSSSYTKNMDLPLGRSYLQFAGANLGFYSIVPIISVVGLKNWSEFDPDGKVALGYTMVSIPYGSILADRAYTKWNLSNGQSFLISLGINLGALNSVGIIQQTDWYSWSQKNPENFARWTTSLVYAGALVGGKIAKEIALENSSITEGDVAFLNLSIGLGYLNSLVLGYAIELNHYKDQTMLTMAGVNGFLYLGNKLNKKYGSLSQGQEKIVALGAGAAYLAWVGTALLTGVDYGERSARYLDAASITAGWYFSRINISSDFSKNDIPTKRKNEMVLAVSPILLNQNRTLVPGVSINLNF